MTVLFKLILECFPLTLNLTVYILMIILCYGKIL